MSGSSRVEKLGAGGGAGCGSCISGHEMSSGTWRSSCGLRSEAVCALGIRESAAAKSSAVGVVRLLPCMDIRASVKKCSMSSFPSVSSFVCFTLSHPHILPPAP